MVYNGKCMNILFKRMIWGYLHLWKPSIYIYIANSELINC
jgi:hypothetical protein